ncbi:prominin-1-A-like [Daktulosphaira vitifoliae]|uniref:prominin-1-A-like n=1 Tax=Daktulosphaira vitifoliae TaxID=58002 RepID=UPI0021A9B721|nr:prominin-1-A-like [Daktulosphaira vitifoliae]
MVMLSTTSYASLCVFAAVTLVYVGNAAVLVNVTYLWHLSDISRVPTPQPQQRLPLSRDSNVTEVSSRGVFNKQTNVLFAVRKPLMALAYTGHTNVKSNTVNSVVLNSLALQRFPSAKYGENVKLDQHTMVLGHSVDNEGVFGISLFFGVGDVWLRSIGVAESLIMWHAMPAELVLDFINNSYDWNTIAKKVLPYEWPLLLVCILMMFSGLFITRYGMYWQRRYKEAKWLGDTGWETGCKKGVIVVAVQVLLLLLGAGACGLIVTNESMTYAVFSVSDLLEFGVGDLVDMFSVTQKQIRTISIGSMDSTTDAVFTKLDDIADNLGGSIENDIYGPNHKFGSRNNVSIIVQDFQKVFPKVRDVIAQAELVKDNIIVFNRQISDLNSELQVIPERCLPDVSVMCDMISANRLHVENYTYLDDMINVAKNILNVENGDLLSLPLTSAESANIPKAVHDQTERERWRIKQSLMDRRRQLEFSIYPYESHTRKLISKLMDMKELGNNYINMLKQIESCRWFGSLGIAIAAILIWVLLACSIVVNCCSDTTWAKCYFFGCVSTMRLTSLVMWVIAFVGLIVSSNSESNVCRALYDEPTYETVSKIMDDPRLTNEHGFFSWFVFGNDTPTSTFNEVLEACKANKTAYSTFSMNKLFNSEAGSEYTKWPGLIDGLESLRYKNIRVNLDDDKPVARDDVLKPIAELTNINFQHFRRQISTSSLAHGRVTLLHNQINALSIQTATHSNSFKTTLKRLVENITDILDNVINPMEQKKNILLYRITLMEVEMQPLSELFNRTWAQAYTRIVSSDFDQIVRKNMDEYINSIKLIFEKYKSHVVEATKKEAASCRPVWNVYRIGRDLICRQALDSLNGFWVICFIIAISITAAIPVVKNFKIFKKSPLTSMSLYTIPPPPSMDLMCTSS